ncbi:MAG: ATP-binding protein [Bacteroidales bacterium]|jgi:two-component system, NtrC family, nitrogen regulation sensor histidine kinase NtrY
MFSKNLYLNIIVRVSLIVVLSALLGYFIVIDQSLRFSIICFLTIVLMTINLISFLNTTNKKIRFFFDSVRNDDSNLSFPVDIRNAGLKELYLSMNKVNQQIQQLKIENRQQEQYFRTLLEQLATGIITYDNKGFILHANSSAKKLLSIDVLTHLQQIERKDQKLFQTIKSIKPFERRLIATITEQGEIQLSLKATSFKTNNNELVILSIQDIKNELDEKEVESWMKLIRVLMHEIMNSITPITSLSESLSNIYSTGGEPVLPEKVTAKTIITTLQGLNVIKEQGKGLMSFVESYRKLTRVPEPEKKLFRVSDLMSRVQILYNSLEKSDKTNLSVSLANPDLEIFADQNLISQVLINILKNALEANETNNDCKIKIVASEGVNNHPEICVIDNGPGIAEENIDEIFVPFFTTRQNGSGIGLSISKQIMRIHGGNLKVRSVPDKETVFCLSF